MENSRQMFDRVMRVMLSMQRYSWEQGVAAQAMLEAGEEQWAILLAKEAVARQGEDGRLAMMEGDRIKSDDPGVNTEAVLFAASTTGDPELARAAHRMIDYLLQKAPRAEDGTFYMFTGQKLIHSDGMFLSIPCLAATGHFEEANRQIDGYTAHLWNAEKKLYRHIWDDDEKRFFREDCWGGGNGWAAAGIVKVINALPAVFGRAKERFILHVKNLFDGCCVHMRQDGLFHDIIDNPSTFVETNLAQMLSYAMFRGVQAGWLNSSYLAFARRMREAARSKVDEFGLVQDVAGSPDFSHPGVSVEGQAFFLLMETAALEVGIL